MIGGQASVPPPFLQRRLRSTKFVNFGSIVFDTGAHSFIAGDTGGLAGTISGFVAGDTIELTGITATGSDYAGGILMLDDVAGSVPLALPGNHSGVGSS